MENVPFDIRSRFAAQLMHEPIGGLYQAARARGHLIVENFTTAACLNATIQVVVAS